MESVFKGWSTELRWWYKEKQLPNLTGTKFSIEQALVESRKKRIRALSVNTGTLTSKWKPAEYVHNWGEWAKLLLASAQALWSHNFCKWCIYTVTKIWNKYSQNCTCAASIPISTFMCLWAICIFPLPVRLFCCIAFADRSWEYINRSQIHESRNWERGRAVSFLRIFVTNLQIFGVVHL